jgi:hypothetical protein
MLDPLSECYRPLKLFGVHVNVPCSKHAESGYHVWSMHCFARRPLRCEMTPAQRCHSEGFL